MQAAAQPVAEYDKQSDKNQHQRRRYSTVSQSIQPRGDAPYQTLTPRRYAPMLEASCQATPTPAASLDGGVDRQTRGHTNVARLGDTKQYTERLTPALVPLPTKCRSKWVTAPLSPARGGKESHNGG